jgi:carbonic anhydrase
MMSKTSDFEHLIRSNLEHAKLFQDKFDELQDAQDPDFVTVCCSDSRVLQDHMWGNEHPGQVFTVSNIGNRTYQNTDNGRAISGDLLYPVEHTDTENIVVVGHTGCGAVTATYQDITKGLDEPEGIEHCIGLLESGIREGVEKLPEDVERDEAINYLVEYNVDQQVEFLRESDEIPSDADIYGVVYDFQDVYSGSRGELHVVNVNGENSVSKLKDQNPEIQDRVERVWEY